MIKTRPARTTQILLMAAAVVTFVTSFAGTAGAATLSGDERDYVNRINALRASVGAGSLMVDDELTNLSRQHTTRMADSQSLFHTTDLTAGLTSSWTNLGENVGYGSNTNLVWNAFLNSSMHYANLVNPVFTHVGVGVVNRDGLQWTTHRFMRAPLSAPPGPGPGPDPDPGPGPGPDPGPQITSPPPTAAPRPTAPPRTTPPPTNAPRPTTTQANFPAVTTTTTTAPPAPVVAPANPQRVATVLNALRAL